MMDKGCEDHVDIKGSTKLSTSPHGVSKDHATQYPKIKAEEPEGYSAQETLSGLLNANEDDRHSTSGEENEEGWIEDDEDGIQYYTDAGFKIRQINEATVVNRTINALYTSSKTPYLILDPAYQRSVVWEETRSVGLIASIFQGYFIPPILFNVTHKIEADPVNPGKKMIRNYRICVDGKQRLTSVRKFMEGLIGVFDSGSPPRKWYYCHPIIDGVEQASTHNIMAESTKKFFRNKTFCCYEYDDLPKRVEENMFQLVQRGMPLTPAERMRAMSTNWASFAKQYEVDYPLVINLSKQARASGFRSVVTIFSQILEVMYRNTNKRAEGEGESQIPTLQASPQSLTRLILDEECLTEAVKATFREVFDKFQELVELCTRKSNTTKAGLKIIPNSAFDPAADFLLERGVSHVRTFSPVELVATAILILVHSESRPAKMLIDDVKEMRHYLRKQHKDLRLNNQCWVTAWICIDTELPKLWGKEVAVNETTDDDKNPEPIATVTAMTMDEQRAVAAETQVNPLRSSESKQPRLSRSAHAPSSPPTSSASAPTSHLSNDIHNRGVGEASDTSPNAVPKKRKHRA